MDVAECPGCGQKGMQQIAVIHGEVELRAMLAAIERHFVDELEQEVIAERIGCTRKTVYNILQTILRRVERLGRRLESVS